MRRIMRIHFCYAGIEFKLYIGPFRDRDLTESVNLTRQKP